MLRFTFITLLLLSGCSSDKTVQNRSNPWGVAVTGPFDMQWGLHKDLVYKKITQEYVCDKVLVEKNRITLDFPVHSDKSTNRLAVLDPILASLIFDFCGDRLYRVFADSHQCFVPSSAASAAAHESANDMLHHMTACMYSSESGVKNSDSSTPGRITHTWSSASETDTSRLQAHFSESRRADDWIQYHLKFEFSYLRIDASAQANDCDLLTPQTQ